RRAQPTAPRRLPGPTARPRGNRSAGTNHGPGSQHHRPRPMRVVPRGHDPGGPGAAPGRRTQARGGPIPRILKALEELLADPTAGAPISGMKWTHRSLRSLRKGLRRRGIKVADATIARLLRDLRFSLRTCRK